MSNSESMSIYGWFTSLLVFAKIVGGLSGDFIIGNKKSIILGSFLQALGAFLLCIPSIYGLYSGLFFVVLGGGMYAPNLTANFGKLFLTQTSTLDSKFTLLYLFTNIGAFIGAAGLGFLAYKYNPIFSFIIAGFLFLLSIIPIFKTYKENNESSENTYTKNNRLISIGSILLLIVLFWTINSTSAMRFLDMESQFKQIMRPDISPHILSQLNVIFLIPLSLIFYFVWNKYFNGQLYKIAFAFIFGALSITILIFIPETPSEKHLLFYIASLLFMSIAEVHIAPLIHSVLTKYSKPNFLATLISLSFLPFALASLIFTLFRKASYENSDLMLIIGTASMTLTGMCLFIYLIRTKKHKLP